MTSTAHHEHRRTVVAGVDFELGADVTGIRWATGAIECRARLGHPNGSLVASDGEIGVLLTDPGVACDSCSDACAR